MQELKLGLSIEFSPETIKQLEDIINKIKLLNEQLDKLNQVNINSIGNIDT